LLRFGEGLVLLRRVERGAQDDAVGRSQVGGPVTQALALAGSAACGRLGIPPEDDPVTLLVSK
jgi:hypothetical protein